MTAPLALTPEQEAAREAYLVAAQVAAEAEAIAISKRAIRDTAWRKWVATMALTEENK
jgi:hypothetical protein